MEPRPRNTFFTSRKDILNLLHNNLQSNQEAVLTHPQAICGLGGIGMIPTVVEVEHNPEVLEASAQVILENTNRRTRSVEHIII